MNVPLQWLSEIYQPAHLGYFVLGFGIAYLWHITKAYYMKRQFSCSPKHLLILVCVMVLGYVVLSTYNYNQCIQEFNQTLRDRSVITEQNDALSRQQRSLLFQSEQAESRWLGKRLNVPPEIAVLDPLDPRREAWKQALRQEYYNETAGINAKILEIEDRQIQLDEERKRRQYPSPTCGD